MNGKVLLSVIGTLACVWACGSEVPPSLQATAPSVPASGPMSTPAQDFAPTAVPIPSNSPIPPTETAPATLPPLPNFDEVITFGAAGGGFACDASEFPPDPGTISVANLEYGRAGYLCATISGTVTTGEFILGLTGLDGITREAILRYDTGANKVDWQAFPGWGLPVESIGTGVIHLSIGIWWPISYPRGSWQVTINGYVDGFSASGTFEVRKEMGRPYIAAIDPRSDMTVMPGSPVNGGGLHPLKPKDNGSIDVAGTDFPRNVPVYLLVYRFPTHFAFEAQFVQKQMVYSDQFGSFRTELAGPFETDQDYYLVGLTDPNTQLSGFLHNRASYPTDFFRVTP